MPVPEPTRYRFGPFLLDTETGHLLREGEQVQAQPKVLDLIAFLASHPGTLVTRDQILDTVWPDVSVSDHAVSQLLRKARVALDDDAHDPRWIQTVYGRGVRFSEDVVAVGVGPPWATFVGRETELDAVRVSLNEPGFVALLGTGGIGKTRLAREASRGHPRGPVWFVDLSAAHQAIDVVRAVASALDVPLA